MSEANGTPFPDEEDTQVDNQPPEPTLGDVLTLLTKIQSEATVYRDEFDRRFNETIRIINRREEIWSNKVAEVGQQQIRLHEQQGRDRRELEQKIDDMRRDIDDRFDSLERRLERLLGDDEPPPTVPAPPPAHESQ